MLPFLQDVKISTFIYIQVIIFIFVVITTRFPSLCTVTLFMGLLIHVTFSEIRIMLINLIYRY